MDSIDLLDVIKAIENYILKFKPNILITHSNSDLNIDHRIILKFITATRPQNNNSVKKYYVLKFLRAQSGILCQVIINLIQIILLMLQAL